MLNIFFMCLLTVLYFFIWKGAVQFLRPFIDGCFALLLFNILSTLFFVFHTKTSHALQFFHLWHHLAHMGTSVPCVSPCWADSTEMSLSYLTMPKGGLGVSEMVLYSAIFRLATVVDSICLSPCVWMCAAVHLFVSLHVCARVCDHACFPISLIVKATDILAHLSPKKMLIVSSSPRMRPYLGAGLLGLSLYLTKSHMCSVPAEGHCPQVEQPLCRGCHQPSAIPFHVTCSCAWHSHHSSFHGFLIGNSLAPGASGEKLPPLLIWKALCLERHLIRVRY
jgi:hypothetical protein